MAGEGDLSWPKGRAKSRGKSWTQRLDNSFIVMILPVHPARVFLAHGRKGVGMQKRLKIGVSLPIPPRRASVCLSACLPACGVAAGSGGGEQVQPPPHNVWLCFCLSRSPTGTGRGRRAGEQWLILWESAPAEER